MQSQQQFFMFIPNLFILVYEIFFLYLDVDILHLTCLAKYNFHAETEK